MALRFAMPPEYDDELLRHQHSSSDDETQIELPEMLAWTRRNLSYATVATTLLIGCGVAALAVASLPVRTVAQQGHTVSSEVGRTLWISNAEIAHGFQLHAVHTHRLHPDGHVTHARHPVQSRQATRRLQTLVQEIGNMTSPRQEVRLLVALSSAAYGPLHGYSEEAYKPVLAASDSVFGADVSTYAEELNRTRAWQEELTSQVEALGDTHVNTALDIDASHKDSIGVHAYEFQRDGYGRVLVFRGSYSDGDYNNIIKWITKWVARRGDYQLKHQWIDLAGFSWSDVPKAGTVYNVGSKLDHYGFIYGAGKQSSEFMKKLQELAKAQGMDPAEVGELAKTGYWELTKKITSSAHNDWTNSSKPGVFRITGHSQGGTRAALSSMFLEKSLGEKYKTVTFAAVGGVCFAREFANGANLLADIDPYVLHDQITDYSHVLDVYGNFDYDFGHSCVYGKANIQTSRAYKYCKDVFGYQAVSLMVAASGNNVLWHGDLKEKFERCRYFTHFLYQIRQDLEKNEIMTSDTSGTTDAGCTETEIPQDDPKGLCPAGENMWKKPDCEAYSTCGTCTQSETSSLGLNCKWCPKDNTCRSAPYAWVNGCEATCN